MKVLITGATGMVGKGVLLECMESNDVSEIIILSRSSLKLVHPKVKEILVKNFNSFSEIKYQLAGLDACFYCMGVTSMGLNENEYSKLTFDYCKNLADVLYEVSPKACFIYVSGTGTDSTEKGNVMWARVKGKTENYILNRGFKDSYAFRPGLIIPEKGVKSKTGWYNFFYVILRPFFPLMLKLKSVTSTSRIGKAMLYCATKGSSLKHLENRDINDLAK
ncbi:MAG: epimerase [Bacteroidia bacterium]